jgi:hypothetical protein
VTPPSSTDRPPLAGVVVPAALAAAFALAVQGCGGGHNAGSGAPQARGPRAPQCVPDQLNRSAVLPGVQLSASPLPGSRDASPATQISLLGASRRRLADVTAVGSLSGRHDGVLRGYSQHDGASFLPAAPFRAGESVTVSGDLLRGGAPVPFSYQFTVSTPDAIPHTPPGKPATGKPGEVGSYRTRPDLHPPRLTVTTRSPNVAPGYLLVTPYAGPGQGGPAIFDNSGNLVWFHPMPRGTQATNFQVQRYRGHKVLTWWQGYIPPQGFGEGEDVIADHSYRQIAVVHAGNGYTSDLHDFQLGPNGTAFPTVFNPVRCDLHAAHGPANAAVTDGVYQEIDVKTGLVRREWHSLDHVALTASHPKPTGASLLWPYDYFHINSIDVDPGGQLLISSRSTWGVYDVDATTGQVRRQLGGKHSDVKLGPGTTVAYQHDARELPGGLISIFDNGADPIVHPQSRGVVVKLNPRNSTVNLVRQYVHPRPLSAGSQGNFQELPNGDAFVGWGPQPYFSEFSPGGQLLFDARLPAPDSSYRGYRFQWSGTPATRPVIAAARAGTAVSVFASWNGATRVVRWRVLAGPSPLRLRRLATAPRTGFESAIAVQTSAPWVAVQALDSSGRVLGSSPATRVARAPRTRSRGRAAPPGRPTSGSLVAERPQTADTNRR